MEDQESASKPAGAPETRHEDSKLEQLDAKLGQFSDRFEKIENTVRTLPAQLGCQDKRPGEKGAEPGLPRKEAGLSGILVRHRRMKVTNKRPGRA